MSKKSPKSGTCPPPPAALVDPEEEDTTEDLDGGPDRRELTIEDEEAAVDVVCLSKEGRLPEKSRLETIILLCLTKASM